MYFPSHGPFLSTPSARRATLLGRDRRVHDSISIHALREEGDALQAHVSKAQCNFYPRPPRGGRLVCLICPLYALLFLSTPSARRATRRSQKQVGQRRDFYPRPPRGGRPLPVFPQDSVWGISIHALREEGDNLSQATGASNGRFLSTPSARRATRLRSAMLTLFRDFYPRPPRGGRRFFRQTLLSFSVFLSTPSARRATHRPASGNRLLLDFYPRPPRGGRQIMVQ